MFYCIRPVWNGKGPCINWCGASFCPEEQPPSLGTEASNEGDGYDQAGEGTWEPDFN